MNCWQVSMTHERVVSSAMLRQILMKLGVNARSSVSCKDG